MSTNNLEALKNELLTQKELIESKGGTVEVANLNPSPSEITTGIGTLEVPDYSAATATASDVLEGKTFYSGSSTLLTGTNSFSSEVDQRMFSYDVDDSSTWYITIPDGTTSLRPYFLHSCPYNTVVTLNSDLTSIGQYAFYAATNNTFANLDECASLTELGNYSFYNSYSLDLAALPDNLTTINAYALYNAYSADTTSIVLPSSLSTLGNYGISCGSRFYIDSLDFNGAVPSSIGTWNFSYFTVRGNIELPEGITAVPDRFNYRGGCQNVVLPSTITSVGNYAFADASASYLPTDVAMESCTILAQTPPTTFSTYALYPHYSQSTFKGIYVPDESVEEYTAASQFSTFASYIKPLSERDW